MSTHSYTRLWTHLIWQTLNREPMLDKRAAAKASAFLNDYSLEKGIYMKINYFNADHTQNSVHRRDAENAEVAQGLKLHQ